MNFAITEEEYNAIDATRGQLELVSGLLCATGASSNLYAASDLNDFLTAQVDSLQAVVQAVDARYKVERESDASLSLTDWLEIIQAVSGRRCLTGARLKAIGRKLQNGVEIAPDLAPVLQAWTDVMTDGGTLPFNLEPSSTDGFLIRFEERVPVVVPPAPAVAATVKKLRNKDGFCQEGANVIGKDYGGVADTTATAKKPTLRKRDKMAATAVTC